MALLALLAAADMQPTSAAMVSTCETPPGLDQVIRRTGAHFIIFGEEHGTEQSPEFVGEVACALSRAGEQVLIALELDASENSALQEAWNGPHDGFPQRLLGSMPQWSGRQDGVGSRAMLTLLERLHALKNEGRSIDVVAFNSFSDRAPDRHEATQAENIRRAAKARPYDHVLVLVGNAHARKRQISSDHGSYKPMAMHLAPVNNIISLLMRRGPGSSWNCLLRAGVSVAPGKPLPPNAIDCDLHVSSRGDPELSGQPRIVLIDPASPDAAKGAYDGYYFVGPVSGSPPAVEKQQ